MIWYADAADFPLFGPLKSMHKVEFSDQKRLHAKLVINHHMADASISLGCQHKDNPLYICKSPWLWCHEWLYKMRLTSVLIHFTSLRLFYAFSLAPPQSMAFGHAMILVGGCSSIRWNHTGQPFSHHSVCELAFESKKTQTRKKRSRGSFF